MNSFFANLVDRHLGTCDTIQPRKLGSFETDRGSMVTASADEGTAPVQSENDQRLQTPGEVSADSPTMVKHKHNTGENNKDSPSPSRPDQNNPAARPALGEMRVAFSDSSAVSRKPQATQSSNADMHSYRETPQPEQLDTTALLDKQRLFTDKSTLTDNNQLHEIAHNKNPVPTSSPGQHVLDDELNHRIRLMLKRLADETRAFAEDDRGRQRNEAHSAILPETGVPLSEPAISSLNPPPASSRPAAREENRFSRHSNNQLHSQLEPPSWLTDLESGFNQHAQQKQANAEPVINVTIGRVEVRAVHTEAPKNARHSNKPAGVMTLDDYLKKREGER